MADSLQSKYKGFIILNKEIGPIELEVDTSAKTVTPSLPDGSEYSIAGGGGLVQVVPEQTVTITSDPASINIANFSELQQGDKLVMKMIVSGYTTSFNYWPMYVSPDGFLTGEFLYNDTLVLVDVVPSGDTADLYVYDGDDNTVPGTYTITVIKAPF